MNKGTCLFILLGLSSLFRAMADDEPNLMKTPLLSRATIQIKIAPVASGDTSAEKAPATPAPKHLVKTLTEVDVTRYDSIQRNALTWSDGSQSEDWIVGKILLMKDAFGNGPNLFDLGGYPYKDAYFFPTARDYFGWVSPATFVARQTHDGKPANFFQRGAEKAWIDPKTGTLLGYSNESFDFTFTFSEPPSSAPTMPPNYQRLVDYYTRLGNKL